MAMQFRPPAQLSTPPKTPTGGPNKINRHQSPTLLLTKKEQSPTLQRGEVGEREREFSSSASAARGERSKMSGEAPAVGGGGGEANGIPPNVTIYINNLNEKIKLDGTLPAPPSVR